jgi:hypothetical protein
VAGWGDLAGPMVICPAAEGRYGLTSLRQAAGRAPTAAGRKISSAMRIAMAPTVLRISAPAG